MYEDLRKVLGDDLPEPLFRALVHRDSGGLYTYFITDFVRSSAAVLAGLGDGAESRSAPKEGVRSACINLSPECDQYLGRISHFLEERVFAEPRVKNRAMMLSTISTACLDLLFNGQDEMLPRTIEDRASLEGWTQEKTDRARLLLRDDVHRVQLAICPFSKLCHRFSLNSVTQRAVD